MLQQVNYLKYGDMGMVHLSVVIFCIWSEEVVPRQQKEDIYKDNREDPDNYRGIILLSVVSKVICKTVNNRLNHMFR